MSDGTNPRFHVAADVGQACEPGDAVLCREWVDSLTKIGLCPVVLGISPEHLRRTSETFELIGQALDAAHLGSFDSIRWGENCGVIYHVPSSSLPAALHFIEHQCRERGVFDGCKLIFWQGDACAWRLYCKGGQL